jgi:hypothetical protein
MIGQADRAAGDIRFNHGNIALRLFPLSRFAIVGRNQPVIGKARFSEKCWNRMRREKAAEL